MHYNLEEFGLDASVSEDVLEAFIDGRWVRCNGADQIDNIAPATEQVIGRVACAAAEDVDEAVTAAHATFPAWSTVAVADRVALLERIAERYEARANDLAAAISLEMGAPSNLARGPLVMGGLSNPRSYATAPRELDFMFPALHDSDTDLVLGEPVGVCVLVTPWSWPMNQLTLKVGVAIAAGATMVLKPSEQLPITYRLFSEILDDAGVPAGVFNMINGTGSEVSAHLARHALVDMVSFIGSTTAGVHVSKGAADQIKRTTLELGGNSPAIILDGWELEASLRFLVSLGFRNSGQSCNAPSTLAVYSAEVLGPVLCLCGFEDDAEAVRLANDTQYGLASYVHGRAPDQVRYITRALRAGMVHVNGELRAPGTPFGGYKMSGIGREGGRWGIEEFCQTKSISGWPT